jgi:predicted dehydrogenase
MAEKLRIGIVGCGGIAQKKHLPALSKLKDRVELVAFCDTVLERAQDLAKRYGIEKSIICTDYQELVANKNIDVIHVCTPNRTHCEITVAALESGKHVMCEKPMAISAADAKKMLDASQRSGKKLTIGYQNRYRPECLYLKKLIGQGELGDIYFAKAHALRRRGVPTWGVFTDINEQGGGPLVDIGTHAIDLTLWEMNNYEPRIVVGSVYHKFTNQTETGNIFGEWDPKQFTVEDSAFGFIVMKNGATIILESSWALNITNEREAKTTLCGTKAGADMDDGLKINLSKSGRLVEVTPSKRKGVDYYDKNSGDPGDLEAEHWIDAILNEKEVFVKPKEAYVVSQILDAVYESGKTGLPVFFN